MVADGGLTPGEIRRRVESLERGVQDHDEKFVNKEVFKLTAIETARRLSHIEKSQEEQSSRQRNQSFMLVISLIGIIFNMLLFILTLVSQKGG